MGPVGGAESDRAVLSSSLHGRYAQAVDRESAYERHEGEQVAVEEPSLVEKVVAADVQVPACSVGTRIGREITRSLFGMARRRR